jgi:hypothetical protein
VEDKIHMVKLHEFWAMRKAGLVNEDTVLYNNLVVSLKDLKTYWKIPFKASWHQEMWT